MVSLVACYIRRSWVQIAECYEIALKSKGYRVLSLAATTAQLDAPSTSLALRGTAPPMMRNTPLPIREGSNFNAAGSNDETTCASKRMNAVEEYCHAGRSRQGTVRRRSRPTRR